MGSADTRCEKRRIPKKDPCIQSLWSSLPSVVEKMATSTGNKEEKGIVHCYVESLGIWSNTDKTGTWFCGPWLGRETLPLPDTEMKCVGKTAVPKTFTPQGFPSPVWAEGRLGLGRKFPRGPRQGKQKHQFATVGHPSSTPWLVWPEGNPCYVSNLWNDSLDHAVLLKCCILCNKNPH